MKKKAIVGIIIPFGLAILVAISFIPKMLTVRPPDRPSTPISDATGKLKGLWKLYDLYTSGQPGGKYRPLHSIEELMEFALVSGSDLSMFSTYNPLIKKETQVVYFEPETYTEDELIFVFREPFPPWAKEKESYSEKELRLQYYIAWYTQSRVAFLESKPDELNVANQAVLTTPDAARPTP